MLLIFLVLVARQLLNFSAGTIIHLTQKLFLYYIKITMVLRGLLDITFIDYKSIHVYFLTSYSQLGFLVVGTIVI